MFWCIPLKVLYREFYITNVILFLFLIDHIFPSTFPSCCNSDSYFDLIRYAGVENRVYGDKLEIPQKKTYAHIVNENKIKKKNGSWKQKIGSKEYRAFKGF